MREFDPNPERIQAEADFTLKDIYDGEKYKEKVEIAWEYDHGDSWLHEVAFLGRADPSLRKGMNIPDELQVICLGGEVRTYFILYVPVLGVYSQTRLC